MGRISLVIIALNEEKRIEACLRSLGWAHEVIVVDGGSADRTKEIASRFTPHVLHRPFDHFSNQKNYALEQATGDWILSIDVDEEVSPPLQKALLAVAQDEKVGYDGYYLKRVNFVFGKPLRFGGQGKEEILRFFRKGKGRFEQPVHEKLVVQGRIGKLSGDLIHQSSPTVSDYLAKLWRYTTFEAELLKKRGVNPSFWALGINPLLRFLYYYVFRLGFLDGYEGFLYHSLSSFYYFFKYVRLLEINRG